MSVVQQLIDKGADVYAVDNNGEFFSDPRLTISDWFLLLAWRFVKNWRPFSSGRVFSDLPRPVAPHFWHRIIQHRIIQLHTCWHCKVPLQRFVCDTVTVISCIFNNIIIINNYSLQSNLMNAIITLCSSDCASVCVCEQWTSQTFVALNANRSKTVKAVDFKFDAHVSMDIPYIIP